MTELALIGRADELELARGMLRRARDGTPACCWWGARPASGAAGLSPRSGKRPSRRASAPRPGRACGWTPAP